MQTSVSGLIASTVRANTAASNIVNSNVRGTTKGATSFKAGYTPLQVEQTTTVTGGVRTNTVPVSPSSLTVYDPRSPLANQQGAVNIPNVSLPIEFAELNRASHTYKANAKVLKTLDDTFKTLLKI